MREERTPPLEGHVVDGFEALVRSAGLDAEGARLLPMPAFYRSDAWHVELSDGRRLFLRRHLNARPGQAAREKMLTDRVADLLSGRRFGAYEAVVPRILATGEVGESLHEFFPGVDPWELEPSALSCEAFAAAGAVLRALHEAPVDVWGMVDVAGAPWPQDDWIGFVRWWFLTTAEIVRDVAARVARATEDLVPTVPSPRLIHGDAGPHNLLIDLQAKRIALIDCESLMGGDPMFDVGTFAGLLASRPDLGAAFESGYFGPEGPTEAQAAACRLYAQLHELHVERWRLHGGREPLDGV